MLVVSSLIISLNYNYNLDYCIRTVLKERILYCVYKKLFRHIVSHLNIN